MLFEEIFELEKILNALARGSTALRGKSVGGSLDGGVDIGGRRQGRASEDLGGGGISDIEEFGGGGVAPGAIDVVLQLGDVGCYGTAHDLLLGICIRKKFRVWVVYQKTVRFGVESWLQNGGLGTISPLPWRRAKCAKRAKRRWRACPASQRPEWWRRFVDPLQAGPTA